MSNPNRREFNVGMVAMAALASCDARSADAIRMPSIYVPHGGGPWPWVARMRAAHHELEGFLRGLAATLPAPPRAILCVTAHWEAPRVTVSTAAAPGMLYDYTGFPKHTYDVQWPAPGSPAVAARVQTLLAAAGIECVGDDARGFDHGTFVPLSVAWPSADVPTVQLSLVKGLDPATHLAIGKALRPLRDEGVLIVGSGMSFHNMRAFRSSGLDAGLSARASAFDRWLETADADALASWTTALGARDAHPREEHLLPLMVVTGAGGFDTRTVPFTGKLVGFPIRALRFG